MSTKFTTVGVDTTGTSFQGYVTCSYATLCEVFGTPMDGDGNKTRAEWEGKTSDGTVFTIYDWKEFQDIRDVTEWYIGGQNKKSVDVVLDILSEHLGDLSKYAVRVNPFEIF